MVSPASSADGATIEVIAFEVCQQSFCFDIQAVCEIRGYTPATALPHSPSYVCGVVNLRGSVMPVLDLSEQLGLGRTTATSRHVVIVVQLHQTLVGFLVDSVQETLVAPRHAFQPPPSLCFGAGFVEGLLSYEGGLLTLLVASQLAAMPTQLAA